VARSRRRGRCRLCGHIIGALRLHMIEVNLRDTLGRRFLSRGLSVLLVGACGTPLTRGELVEVAACPRASPPRRRVGDPRRGEAARWAAQCRCERAASALLAASRARARGLAKCSAAGTRRERSGQTMRTVHPLRVSRPEGSHITLQCKAAAPAGCDTPSFSCNRSDKSPEARATLEYLASQVLRHLGVATTRRNCSSRLLIRTYSSTSRNSRAQLPGTRCLLSEPPAPGSRTTRPSESRGRAGYRVGPLQARGASLAAAPPSVPGDQSRPLQPLQRRQRPGPAHAVRANVSDAS
jgi:hypothetical protein